eukprot:CAMPEP_0181323114 /NCGR_PEP_ID=MMETSP1101-20121128/19601_1 /TAXON_ID=46948 /ORGANISM="Rhodomonas abbreviata, Strain Caron Lab Isolate" /LENGTH=214 /DNA_ID=CAMNT_0023431097 /DNA_START=13 /DNA_END=657 /DNA_ORIENTATION=+
MATLRSRAALSVALLLALAHSVEGFTSPVSLSNGGLVSRSSCIHRLPLRTASRGTGLQLQMQDSKTEEKVKQAKKEAEMNLCDVNEELCDGEVHTTIPGVATHVETPEEKENMMTKVKKAGIAGLISYAAWEFVFWTVSAPAAIIAYHSTTGEWPSFSNPESTAKVSAVIFGFLNVARALVPLRIGVTLATVPLVDKYIVKPLGIGKDKDEEEA